MMLSCWGREEGLDEVPARSVLGSIIYMYIHMQLTQNASPCPFRPVNMHVSTMLSVRALLLLLLVQGSLSSPGDESCDDSGGAHVSLLSRRKRGLAYNNATLVPIAFAGGSRCSSCGWAYNWDSRDNGLTVQGLEFVPMLWGPIPEHTGRWWANVKEMIGKGSTHVLSFNECDIFSQCNTGAAEAAEAHVAYINPLAARVRIGSPAVSNSDIDGQGLDWLQDWVYACENKGCAYDFCVVHWYSPPADTASLFDHIRRASTICGGRPIWLTEFSPLPPDQGEMDYSAWLGAQLPALEGLDILERYAFFMVEDGRLIASGRLSPVGEVYTG